MRGFEEQFREILIDEPRTCYFDYTTIENFSNDFIREFKDKIYFCDDVRIWIKHYRGEKFHKELFGK